MKKFHATEIGKQIWDGYKLYRLLGSVIRAGCALTGANGPPKDKTFEPFTPFPLDTDISHSAGICKLLSLISAHYPQIIPREEIFNYHTLAEVHDMGELDEGDLPDDGTRDKRICDENELVWIEAYLAKTYPSDVVNSILEFYNEFESKSTTRGKIFYLLGDKLDNILMSLVMESLKRKPNILNKVFMFGKNPDVLLDVQSTEFTETTSAADNFLYCEFYNPEFFSYPHLDIFFEIIQSAALDVRGEEMLWLNAEIEKRTSGFYDTT